MAFSAPWLPLRHGGRQVEKLILGPGFLLSSSTPPSCRMMRAGLRPLPSQGVKRGSLARTIPQGRQGGGPGLDPGPARVHSEQQAWLTVPGLACHCCVGVTALGPLCLGLFVCLSETGLIRLVDCLERWNERRNSTQSLLRLKHLSSQCVLRAQFSFTLQVGVGRDSIGCGESVASCLQGTGISAQKGAEIHLQRRNKT